MSQLERGKVRNRPSGKNNRKGGIFTANPQMENGFTPIANEILEAAAGASLNGTQLRILLLLWRNSYGFHKRECPLPLSYLAKKLRGNKSTIARQIRRLEALGVLSARQEQCDGHTPKLYAFCKDYTRWQCGAGEVDTPTHSQQNSAGSVGQTANRQGAHWRTEKDKLKYKNKYKSMQKEKQKSRYDYDEIMRKTFLNVTRQQKGEDNI